MTPRYAKLIICHVKEKYGCLFYSAIKFLRWRNMLVYYVIGYLKYDHRLITVRSLHACPMIDKTLLMLEL